MLIGRSGTCGEVPVRSTVSSSPSTVMVDRDLQVAPRRIRIVEIAVDEGLGRVDAVGSVADRAGASAARSSPSGLRRRRSPCRGRSGSIRSRKRCAPICAAAICASMSPTTRSGMRMLSRSMCQTASLRRPCSYDLDRLELQSFGIGVDRIDDAAAARRVRADVEVVRGRDREADQLAAVEHRHAERHVGAVRGAAHRDRCA